MLIRISAVLVLAAVPALSGDWNPRLAAQYLDARVKSWFAWPPAMSKGVPCVSCHTSVPYLLARPALGRALGESTPTLYEAVLLDGVRARVIKTDAKELVPDVKGLLADQETGAEAVLAALLLAIDDEQRGHGLSPEGEKAFERMWSLQIRTGKNTGAWHWSDFDLDPWETADAAFYGAALGALATGVAPARYQSRPEIRENVAALTAYLQSAQKTQPLHNRLILLWASTKLRDVLPQTGRQAILDEIWHNQQEDGGWTMESLGAWKQRPNAPPANGSSSYATGLVAFILQQAEVRRASEGLSRAITWLQAHQDPQSGYWPAESMNKKYEAGSMPSQFMRDAATAFASLALAGGHPGTD